MSIFDVFYVFEQSNPLSLMMSISFFFILTLSFFNFVVILFFGRNLSQEAVFILTVLTSGITLLSVYFIFYFSIFERSLYIFNLGKWIHFGMLHVDFIFVFDGLAILMLVLVSTISFSVHIYSFWYMSSDESLKRYISYLSLFTFFMIILVTSYDFVVFFLSWEGVGLSSFLLISFWHKRVEARKAAVKSFVFNRVGDCSFLGATGIIYSYVQNLDFATVFSVLPLYKNVYLSGGFFSINLVFLVNALLFVGVMCKSAQVMGHCWLFSAMEAPSPTSALIHSATMVTAGVYLMIRTSYLFELSPDFLKIVAGVGVITTFLSSIFAIFQFDVKKIIAYSTCSQLGYMVMACGCSGYAQAFFHLFTHGYFKALLFLSAGVLIHNLNDEQDIRKMGGLFQILPMTYVFFLIGSASLVGLPFTSGYYSKDSILDLVLVNPNPMSIGIFHLAALSVMFTTIYSIRLIYYVFIIQPNGNKGTYLQLYENQRTTFVNEAPIIILFILSFLSLASIFTGYLFKDLIIGNGNDYLNFSIYNESNDFVLIMEGFVYSYKIIPFIYIFLGIFIFYISLDIDMSPVIIPRHYFYNEYIYKIYCYCVQDGFINHLLLDIGRVFLKFSKNFVHAEKTFLEIIGPYGLYKFFTYLSEKLAYMHANRNFSHYLSLGLLMVFLFFFLIMVYSFWS